MQEFERRVDARLRMPHGDRYDELLLKRVLRETTGQVVERATRELSTSKRALKARRNKERPTFTIIRGLSQDEKKQKQEAWLREYLKSYGITWEDYQKTLQWLEKMKREYIQDSEQNKFEYARKRIRNGIRGRID